ncbi:MAG: hypothetical protein U0974_04705, partial [Gemmatimonadales bacterium]|nr:hypothetical protein [Gemmatimonadales bacterium]
ARTVIDTLVVTSAPVPLAMSVSPSSRSITAQAGSAVGGDSATVTLSGDNSGGTQWSATKRKAWTTLTTASGTGSGKVKWNRSSSGLAAGTYVDTITVAASGVSARTVIDTLVVTTAPVPLAMSVSPSSRSITAQAGSAVGGDSATVTLSGDNSGSTQWSATKRKAWTTLTTASGTGSGKVKWNRSTSGLAAGTYVDTITVAAAGVSSRTVIDTLVVTSAPVPLALSVSPTSRKATVQAGTAAPADSATVTLSGDNSASTAWSATKKKAWTTLTTASGTGSGKVRWNRSTSGLAAGTDVDTITVAAAGVSSRTVIDTLVVTTAPVPLALSVSPTSRKITAQTGTAVGGDSATVTLSGDNSGSTAWSATKRKSWTTLTVASGTGSGKVKWNRSTSGLAVGTYVDTITVAAAGVSARTVIDTLVVTSAPVPLAMSVSPSSRNATVQAGTAAPNDSATVTLSGDNSGNTAWSATKRKSWTTLTTASGTGSGKVKWNRSTSGLAAGTYVDTITVAAAGVSSRTVVDTLVVTSAPVPLAMSVSPSSRSITAQAGSGVGGDSATVTLSGDNSGSTAWSATKRKSWTTLTTASGTGSGKVKWNRSTSGLAAGTYVDTITVTASGVVPHAVIDTLVITETTTTARLSKGGGKTRTIKDSRGKTASVGQDTTSVTASLDGESGGTSAPKWVATTGASWIRFVDGATPTEGAIVWTRDVSQLPAGQHVDSVVVSLQGNPVMRGVYTDTVVVVVVADPSPTNAVDELVRGNRLTGDQRDFFDATGNRNGRFDLGDFLAWVDRNGIRLSASLTAQLAEVSGRP